MVIIYNGAVYIYSQTKNGGYTLTTYTGNTRHRRYTHPCRASLKRLQFDLMKLDESRQGDDTSGTQIFIIDE